MPSLLFMTGDKSFSVEIPLTWIDGKYYVERAECENAVNKAFAEIERLRECIKTERLEKDKTVCEMQAHIKYLQAELEEVQKNKVDLPFNPIDTASCLIYRTDSYIDDIGKKNEYNVYGISELKQIAEHLLVHINNLED